MIRGNPNLRLARGLEGKNTANYIFAVLNVTLKRGNLYKLEIPGYGMDSKFFGIQGEENHEPGKNQMERILCGLWMHHDPP